MGAAVILFDGVCNLCNHTVDFVLRYDRAQRYHFASLQSEAAQTLLSKQGLNVTLDSVVLLEDGKVYTASSAPLRIARHLGWRFSWLSVFLLVPRPIRDEVYAFIAKRRYQWFGKKDSCRLPTPEERARFL